MFVRGHFGGRFHGLTKAKLRRVRTGEGKEYTWTGAVERLQECGLVFVHFGLFLGSVWGGVSMTEGGFLKPA